MADREPRPSREEYNMALAVEIASRSNCMTTHVGAIILHRGRIRAVGYNGTVEGYDDCFKGGCPRCKDTRIKSGEQLDRCICVHAEENALVSAARFGIEVGDAECYVTHEPCLGCTKLLIQARMKQVVYLKVYQHPNTTDQNESRKLMRDNSKERKGTIFQEFSGVMGERLDSAKVDEWKKRLDRMKAETLEYARRNGIIQLAP